MSHRDEGIELQVVSKDKQKGCAQDKVKANGQISAHEKVVCKDHAHGKSMTEDEPRVRNGMSDQRRSESGNDIGLPGRQSWNRAEKHGMKQSAQRR
jgi:hypothetical protein